MRRIPMVRCSAFAALRVSRGRGAPRRRAHPHARRVCRERLSQLYLAWGEGVIFAALARPLVRKCFRSPRGGALSQMCSPASGDLKNTRNHYFGSNRTVSPPIA
eukprot:5545081-Prymnesium_polylepis.1